MPRFSEKVIAELRHPLGALVKRIGDLDAISVDGRIISVGDICTISMLEAGRKPHLAVFDFKSMRSPLPPSKKRILAEQYPEPERMNNPKGTLSREILEAAPTSLKKGGALLIEGEEDLTALAFILAAGKDDIIVYGRAVGLAYVEGRDDATPADVKRRAWKARWPHYIRIHHAEFVAGTIGNGISLNALMAALEAKSFASTKRNAAARKGNTNPRKAIRQQPDVRLSEEGFAWLNQHLGRAFDTHGKLSAADLEALDWPHLPQ